MNKMISIFTLLFCGSPMAEDANFSKRGEMTIENDDKSKDTKSSTKKKRQASKSSKNKQATSKSPVATGEGEKTSQRKIPRFVDELYAVSNGQLPSELEYPYEKKAEMDGMFVGAIFGPASIAYEWGPGWGISTITAKSMPLGLNFGYKHFISSGEIGARYYVNLLYVNANANTYKSMHLSLDGYFDMLFNFINKKKVNFGMYLGLGFLWDNFMQLSGDKELKGGGAFMINVGFRSAIVRNHNVELGAKFGLGGGRIEYVRMVPYVAYSYTFDL